MVRAGCGEFDGERNVCVYVGLGHGYTENAYTKSDRSLSRNMHFNHLEVISSRARRSGNGREKNLKQAKQASKDALAPWRAVVPAAESHSYNKHTFNPLRSAHACPSEKPPPQSGRVRRL